MQWSKLKSRIREFLAPEVQSRVDFHLTNYRTPSGHGHEFWVTVDQKQVFSASNFRHSIEGHILSRSSRTVMSPWSDGLDGKIIGDELTQRAIHSADNAVASCRTYLDIDPQIALTSSDPILCALALLDRRIGTRTLQDLEIDDSEHPLVRHLYSLRMESIRREVRGGIDSPTLSS